MSVPKGKRKESQFEVIKHFYRLRKDITDLLLRDFGYNQNPNKTMICKLSEYWRYLQIQYALTDTGRIIKKIHSKRLTEMRRKLKKLTDKLDKMDFINYYNSWFNNYYKIMSKQQRENMNTLFNELREEYYVYRNTV